MEPGHLSPTAADHDVLVTQVLKRCFPCGFFGEDRDGHPVWYDNMGNLDFRGNHCLYSGVQLVCSGTSLIRTGDLVRCPD